MYESILILLNDWKYNCINSIAIIFAVDIDENVEAWKKAGVADSGSMMKRFGGGVVYQSDLEVACLRSRRWMGIRRLPLLQKASKIEAGAIAAREVEESSKQL